MHFKAIRVPRIKIIILRTYELRIKMKTLRTYDTYTYTAL
jgi:hypothetical protein